MALVLVLTATGAATTTTASPGAGVGDSSRAAAGCPRVPQPASMENPAFYRYVHTFDPRCAAHTNWDRTFADVQRSTSMGSGRLSVTAATALGGALASLRVDDTEYIASGGHGAALQWAFHAWNGGAATECYNPTQAGSRPDDAGPPPFHGPSTSALYRQAATGRASIQTGSRPAMYIPRSMTTPGFGGCLARDHQPDRSPFMLGLSPYWLDTTVQLSPDTGLDGLDNVVRLQAHLTSEDAYHAHFDGVLAIYLQRRFTATFAYDPATRLLTRHDDDFASLQPVVRCTSDRAHCLGAYFRPTAMPGAYYWVQTDEPAPYNGMSGAHIAQVTVPATGVGQDGTTRLDYEVHLAVGNLSRVTSALDALHDPRP